MLAVRVLQHKIREWLNSTRAERKRKQREELRLDEETIEVEDNLSDDDDAE